MTLGRSILLGFSTATLLALANCRSDVIVACTDELIVGWTPGDTTIRVGESFDASISLATCGGRKQLTDALSWRASDTSVLRVDSATGHVTARAAGTAQLSGAGQTYGPLAQIAVTVR